MLNSNDNLSGVWFMDETAGLNRVDSHNGYIFTDVNGLASPAGVDGLCAQAIEGNNEYLKVAGGTPAALRLGGDIDWCIHFHGRIDGDFGSRQYLISRLLIAGDQIEFMLQYVGDGADILRFNVSSTGAPAGYNSVDSTVPLLNSTWHWIFIGHDSVNNLLIVGVDDVYNTKAHAAGMHDSANARFDCFLANAQVGALGATASIDNLHVWKNKLLTTAQRTAIFDGSEAYPFISENTDILKPVFLNVLEPSLGSLGAALK